MAVASHIQDINNTDQSLSSPEAEVETQVMNSTHSEAIGKIASIVEGPVTAETPEGQTRALKEGDSIHLDETITTAVDSYVRMILNDGTVFQLGPQSRARLDKYAYDPAGVGGEFESSVAVGTFRYISGKISGHNQGQHTLIKTPSAHIGIRGSEIDIQVNDQGSTTIIHLSGLISVTSPYYGEEQIVYEHGTTIHISIENTTPIMINTLTESQIQQVNQKWDVFGSAGYVNDPNLSPPRNDNSNESHPDTSSPPDTQQTPTPDAGARNPFAAVTKDVNQGESIDEPVSGQETLREYGQVTGIAESPGMSLPSEIAITARLGTGMITLEEDNFTTTGLANGFQEPSDIIQEQLIANRNISFVEKELLQLKGEIIQPEESFSDNILPSPNSGSTSDSSSTDNPLPTDSNQEPSSPSDNSSAPPGFNNQAPIIQTDFWFLNNEVNAPFSISVASLLENDQDRDGDPLRIIDVTAPKNGAVQLVTATEIIFTPQTPFSQGGFNYLVSDGKVTTPGEVIIIHNLAPIAHNDQLIIQDLAPLTIIDTRQLLANDSDPNADTLKIISVSQAGFNSNVAFNQQGDIVFTPYSNFITDGFGQFTYEISDGHDRSAIASVTVILDKSVPPDLRNQPPVSRNDQVEIHSLEPTKITIEQLLANDSDPDNDNLSIIRVQNGLNSQVTLEQTGGKIIFTPTATFTHSEQFTYEISDGHDHTVIATVTVTLKPNLPPVANPDGPFDMTVQEQISLPIPELLRNDFDPNGDPLTLNRITESLKGTATLDGQGNIIFTRDTYFQGEGGFTYEITDGRGGSATAPVTLIGNLLPPTSPQPQSDKGETNKNQSLILPMAFLLVNDSPQGKLTITAANNAIHGEVQLDPANNQVIFKPELNFSGQAHFDYVVVDNQGVNATTTVNIAVNNRVPLANPDLFATVSNNPLWIANADLLKNDKDPDGDIDKLSVVSVTPINQNTVTLNGEQILFTPAPDFEGQARFSYTIADTSGSTATIPVTVMVERLVQEDQLNTGKNQSLTVAAKDLLANDNDPNLTLVAVTPVEQGTVVQDTDGNIVFTPTPDFIGEAQFQYSVTDSVGRTDRALVKVQVTNTPPVAQDDTFTVTANQVLTISISELLANDQDTDPGETLTLVEVSPANSGEVKWEKTAAEILFTPAENMTGEAAFKYTITDTSEAPTTATVNITVTPSANLPPIITLPNSPTPLSYRVQNESLLIDKAATVTDPDSLDFADGTLEIAISPQRSPYDILEIQNQGSLQVSSSNGGEITFDGTTIGSFFTLFSTHNLVVKLNENANSANVEALLQAIAYRNSAPTPLKETLTVKMTLSDGDGGTSEIVSRNIEIATTNTPPVAKDESISRPFNTPTTIAVTDLLQNDSDVNPTDILSISEITPLSNGVQAKLVGNEIQLFIDALVDNHFEPVTLNYQVTDGNNGEDLATVTITPDNIITGTSGNDNLAGTSKLDIILGQAGDDTFVISKGSDILFGGEGDDLFILDPTIANSVSINGDSGVNTLSLAGTKNQILDLITNQRLPLEQQINLDYLSKIDLASGHNQLRLSIEDVLDLSDTHQLMVEGDATNMVNSVSQGWHNEGIDPTGLYNRYTHENAELLVSIDISNQFIS